MTPSEARITIVGVPDVPGTSLEIFSRLADRKITVDMIVQNVGEKGKSDISFTVPCSELEPALQAVQEAAASGAAPARSHTTIRSPKSPWSDWAWRARRVSPTRCSAPWRPKVSISR